MNAAARLLPLAWVFLLALPLSAQTTTRISMGIAGAQGDDDSWGNSISGDGRFVAFESWATNLAPNDTNGLDDVFVRDLLTGTTLCVSVDAAGVPANSLSHSPSISADGRFVAFSSLATNLVAGDTNGTEDVFVRDLVLGTTVMASRNSSGVQGNHTAWEPSISGDGSKVAFSSYASNLVTGDANMRYDVFVRDLATGQTVRASVSSAGVEANNDSRFPVLSRDGSCVAFFSAASNLVAGDSNLVGDGFVRELGAGLTTRISVSSSGAQSTWATEYALAISETGRYVAFATATQNFVAGDTSASMDLFLRDRTAGQTSCISLNQFGAPGTGWSGLPGLSADGRFVVFTSVSASLVPGDTNNAYDEFVRDTLSGQTTRISVTDMGAQGIGESNSNVTISDDGRRIAFDSSAQNLVPGDTNGVADVFVRDLDPLIATAMCFGDGTQATACPCGNSGASGHGCENSAATGGAWLVINGSAEPNFATLSATGLLPSALAIFLHGDMQLATPVLLGDGMRCAGGALKRLYIATAAGGAVSAPAPGELPLGVQSALLGAPITPGSTRFYQVWYRDSDASFCSAPQGDLSNLSNGVRVDW